MTLLNYYHDVYKGIHYGNGNEMNGNESEFIFISNLTPLKKKKKKKTVDQKS